MKKVRESLVPESNWNLGNLFRRSRTPRSDQDTPPNNSESDAGSSREGSITVSACPDAGDAATTTDAKTNTVKANIERSYELCNSTDGDGDAGNVVKSPSGSVFTKNLSKISKQCSRISKNITNSKAAMPAIEKIEDSASGKSCNVERSYDLCDSSFEFEIESGTFTPIVEDIPLYVNQLDSTSGNKPKDSPKSEDSANHNRDRETVKSEMFGDITFSFFPEIKNGSEIVTPVGDKIQNFDDNCIENTTMDESKSEGHYEILNAKPVTHFNKRPTVKLQQRRHFLSRSASNLHKSELKIFLERPPSLECMNFNLENADSNYDFPKHTKHIHKTILDEAKITNESDVENDSKVVDAADNFKTSRKSVNISDGFEEISFKNYGKNDEDANFENLKRNSISSSKLNLEYCEHRSRLHPRMRRVTLLRNQKPRYLIANSARFTKVWRGFKVWVGDEKQKLDKVVQKHAAMQRVGAVFKTSKDDDDGDEEASESRWRVKSSDKMSEKRSSIDSNLVKNDVFFESVDKSDQENSPKNCEAHSKQSSDGVSENSEPKSESKGDTLSFGTMRSAFRRSRHFPEGQNGYEELRRHIKNGGDLSKELAAILQERADTELTYAKNLHKLSVKLNRACRDNPGGVVGALRGVACDMEGRGEVHKQFSTSLSEEIIKPLKQLIETQHKTRKQVESSVDKTFRGLTDWRSTEAKSKKQSHAAARDNEKMQDAMLDAARLSRAPSISILSSSGGIGDRLAPGSKHSEKDGARQEHKRKKAEDQVKRADVEYYTLCVRAERARLEWEVSVTKGSAVLQALEEQRLLHLQQALRGYLNLASDMGPSLMQITDRLRPSIVQYDPEKDMATVRSIRRTSDGPCEQLLPDFYCEHTTLGMNRERRKQALVKLLQLVRQDLERERRSRSGVESLSQALKLSSGFGVDDSQQNVSDKLYHMRSMLLYLEGARYKLQSALCELDHKPKTNHPLAPHIKVTRDRAGLQQSVLKVPPWLHETLPYPGDKRSSVGNSTPSAPPSIGTPPNTPLWDQNMVNCRGAGDGLSNQRDSDFDEFSSQESFNDCSPDIDDVNLTCDSEGSNHIRNDINGDSYQMTTKDFTDSSKVLGHCKALYDYSPKLYDELELKPDDVISVLARQEDGWWVGRLGDKIGIFPATYVQEIELGET